MIAVAPVRGRRSPPRVGRVVAADLDEVRVRVGCTGSGFFNPLVIGALRAFGAAYPEVSVVLEEGNTGLLLERRGAGFLDAAFLRLDGSPPPGLRAHGGVDEPMQIALQDSHPRADAPALPLAALAGERFVLFLWAMGPSLHDTITNACRAAGFEPIRGQEAQQFPSIVNLVASGLGVSVVPASLAQVRVAGVRFLPIDGPAPLARLQLVSNRASQARTLQNFLARVGAQGATEA